jgi:hypothetical protein
LFVLFVFVFYSGFLFLFDLKNNKNKNKTSFRLYSDVILIRIKIRTNEKITLRTKGGYRFNFYLTNSKNNASCACTLWLGQGGG